jgi:hypothetical protein
MKRKTKMPRPIIDREVMTLELGVRMRDNYISKLDDEAQAKQEREEIEEQARKRERQQRQEAGRTARKGKFKVNPAALQARLTGIMARNPDLSLTSARNRVARKHGLTIKTTTRHTRRPTLQELEQARQRPERHPSSR